MNPGYFVRIHRNGTKALRANFPERGDIYGRTTTFSADDNLGSTFVQVCRQHSGFTAVSDDQGDLTYQWLADAASRVARSILEHNNFKPGGRVGLLIRNSAEYVASFYGILLAGGVVVPLSPNQKSYLLGQLCELVQPCLIIDSPSEEKTTRLLVGDACGKPELINLETGSGPAAGPGIASDRLAMILFTSGSSGKPKGVMLSHRNLLSNASSILNYLPIQSDDRALAVVPMAHALGNSVLQTHILWGEALVFSTDIMFPVNLLETLESRHCTSLTGVPEMIELLYRGPGGRGRVPKDLRYVAVAGGRLAESRARQLARSLDPAQLYLMYGQTEATARLAWLPPEQLDHHASSIGIAIPGVELEVRSDGEKSAKSGEVGTLYARGPNIMLGYWNDPQGTARVMRNGWLDTGDLATIDPQGMIRLCGRRSQLLKIQGHRFHPMEIEHLLQLHFPEIRAAAIPEQFNGYTRIALVVEQRGTAFIDWPAIRRVCRKHLPAHMVPGNIRFVEQLPLNPAQKLDRQALVRRFTATAHPAA